MLAHDIVKYEASEPSAYVLFLHGILGTRANWRSIARRFVESRPEWGGVLVDLREHGDSIGRTPPHTVEAAAADVVELEQALTLPVRATVGHSFGGKVALQWMGMRRGESEVWLIDSCPGRSSTDPRSSAAGGIVTLLEGMGAQWPSRDAFVEAVVEAGEPEPIAQWLAMNLRRQDDGSRTFGPDLSAIRSMIEDYAATDLWPMVESPPESTTIHAVIGGRSQAFTTEDRRRFQAAAERQPRVFAHLFDNAGHWVHVDSTDRLLSLLTSQLGEQR